MGTATDSAEGGRLGFLAWLLTGICAVTGSSCQFKEPVQHGDATRHGAIGGALTNFSTSDFPIGREGKQDLEITGLTAPAFPERVRVLTRKWDPSGWRGYTRWEDTLLRMELLDYEDGRVFHEVTFRLSRHREVGAGEYDCRIYRNGAPRPEFRERYRIRVTVLEAAPREWDKARFLLR